MLGVFLQFVKTKKLHFLHYYGSSLKNLRPSAESAVKNMSSAVPSVAVIQ
jgi:hypothetical protein